MKHCFFFLWDGASYSYFKELLETGYLPHIKKYLLSSGEFKKIHPNYSIALDGYVDGKPRFAGCNK